MSASTKHPQYLIERLGATLHPLMLCTTQWENTASKLGSAISTHEMGSSAGLTRKHPFLTSAGATLAHSNSDRELWLS